MIVRLLLSRVSDRMNSPGWLTVLRSAGAADTYLRTYRGALDAARVVQFLLMDRLFPRSVFHALRQAEVVPRPSWTTGPVVRIGAKAEALRLLGRARSELEFLRPEELLDDLSAQLLSLQGCIRDVGEAVSRAVLPRRALGGLDRTGGVADGLAHPGRAHHRLLLRDAGARVLQRGAAHPAQRQPAERDRQPGRDHARHPVLPLRRLLGHHRHGVRPARPAHRARRHRDVRGRDGRRARPGPLRHLGGAGGRGGAATATPRCWSSPTTSNATATSARAARALKRGKDPADAVLAACALGARAPRLPARHHRRAHRRGRGVGGAHRRLPGLRAPHAAAGARDGRPGPLRVGLPAAAAPTTEIRQTVAGRATPGSRRGPAAGGATTRPTTCEIGHRHVWVAVGRDYADVPPLKGIYSGGEAAALDVTVDMTRLA